MCENPPFEVCFNHLSLYGEDKEKAFNKMYDAFLGVLHIQEELYADSKGCIYYADEKPGDYPLCDGYTLTDFREELDLKDPDSAEALLEFSDEALFTDGLSIDKSHAISTHNYTINGWSGKDVGLHFFALICNCYLLSLPYGGWDVDKVQCYKRRGNGDSTIDNIHSMQSAKNIVNSIHNIEDRNAYSRTFILDSGKLYIYFKDHAPPHVHFRAAEEQFSVTISDSPCILCGNASSQHQNEVFDFIVSHKEEMQRTWDHVS